MAEKIQISAGESSYISALYNAPMEMSTRSIGETLIIMSHSFPGHKSSNNDLYGDLEFLMVDKGYHTLRFDFRGCGESDGREEDFTLGAACEDFQNVLFWAKTKGYKRFVYVGEGLGAGLSVMNHDLDVICYVMLWPALNYVDFRKHALEAEKITASEKKAGYVKRNNNRVGITLLEELNKIDLIYALREVRSPCLIMHGVKDKKVPISGLDLARAHMRSNRIEITTFQDGESGLTQLNHRKAMFYHVQQFLEKYL